MPISTSSWGAAWAAPRSSKRTSRPQPYPDDWPTLQKLSAQFTAATALNQPVKRTPINVTFEDGVNHVGVEQRKCSLCGDCVSGCNYGAKNTTLMNYLPDAHNHGADIFTGVRRQAAGAGRRVALSGPSPLSERDSDEDRDRRGMAD